MITLYTDEAGKKLLQEGGNILCAGVMASGEPIEDKGFTEEFEVNDSQVVKVASKEYFGVSFYKVEHDANPSFSLDKQEKFSFQTNYMTETIGVVGVDAWEVETGQVIARFTNESIGDYNDTFDSVQDFRTSWENMKKNLADPETVILLALMAKLGMNLDDLGNI